MKNYLILIAFICAQSSFATLSPPASGGSVDSVNGQTGVVVVTKSDVGLSNVDNTSDANKPVSSATTTALNLKEDSSNKDTDGTLAANSDAKYASQKAAKTYTDTKSLAAIGGLPSGVLVTNVNKGQAYSSKDGLVIQHADSATQTNAAGGFNGSGTGQKSFVEFTGYDNAALSSITSLKFTARGIRDAITPLGKISWNILANFANGFLTAANDYAILIADGAPDVFTQFFILTGSHAEQTITDSTRGFKCVGGTGQISFTGDVSSGSNQVTNVSGTNINALTVGMYVRKTPTGTTAAGEANMPFPDGSTITAINVAGNSFTVSANSAITSTTMSFKQYGGIAPDTRASTANGTTTVTIGGRTSDSVTTTADLQVNMKVTGAGVPANSYIVSMVANTSITLNNSVTAGSPTLSFYAMGKTGIPGNGELIGIPLSRIVANNPSAFISNNAPMTPIWAAADGGAPKNILMQGGIQLVFGSSSLTSPRTISVKNATINSTLFKFAE